MDLWIPINFLVAVIAAYFNFKRMRPGNPRFGLRMAGFVLASYVGIVYFLAFVGVINHFETPNWLRWFQAVLMFYFIVEARNG